MFAYQFGEIEDFNLIGDGTAKRVVDLPLPRGRKKAYPDQILDANSKITLEKPWTLGLVEAMAVVDTISRKRFKKKPDFIDYPG